MTATPAPLLRSPLELASTAVFAAAALVFAVAPHKLNLNDLHGYCIAAVMLLPALYRARQAWRVLRYQRTLVNRRQYVIRKIPVSQERIFLGRGFEWSQPHVQRVKESLNPAALKYRRGVAERGGDPVLHGVGLLEGEKEVWSSLKERFGHMLVLGATRVGKTRLAELLISQDIQRGDVVIVLDPKGDSELLCRMYCEAKRAGRLDRMRVLHLRHPEYSQNYNPIATYNSPGEIASRIAEQLPSRGQSAAFKEFAWRFVNTIAQALDALSITPSYRNVYEHLQDIEPLLCRYYEWLFSNDPSLSNWQREVAAIQTVDFEDIKYSSALLSFRKNCRIEDDIAKELEQILRYDKVHYDKLIASLLPLLNKLKTGRTASVLTTSSDPDRTIDWLSVVENRGIVYVGLDALANPAVARAVGNAMFADLASAVGRIYATMEGIPGENLSRIAIHADEFNDIVGPHLHPLLSKAGGAGVQITAYTQTMADIEASLDGDRAAASRVIGNFNSLVMLRVRTLDTARTLADQVPKFDVLEHAESASVADSSQAESDVAFTSSASERISARSVSGIEPSDLMRLPKGEGYALLDGGSIWKIRIPLIEDDREPKSVVEIMKELL